PCRPMKALAITMVARAALCGVMAMPASAMPTSNLAAAARDLAPSQSARYSRHYHASTWLMLSNGSVARASSMIGTATLRPLPSLTTGLPRFPEPPFRRAVPTTPADRAGAHVDYFPAHAAFPTYPGGSASALSLSRPAQALLALRPAESLSRPK